MFMMNEKYRAELERHIAEQKPRHPGVNPLPFAGIPIQFSPHVPATAEREVYHPPEGDRFIEYGPEDHGWLETLCRWSGDPKYGRIERVEYEVAYAVDEAALRQLAFDVQIPQTSPMQFGMYPGLWNHA